MLRVTFHDKDSCTWKFVVEHRDECCDCKCDSISSNTDREDDGGHGVDDGTVGIIK